MRGGSPLERSHSQKSTRQNSLPHIPLDNSRYNEYCYAMQSKTKSSGAAKIALEAEVFIRLIRTADALARGVEALFRTYNLSPTQYNVLRILRGAGDQGLACRDVGCRLITRDPDITRLFDRLEARGLISRAREVADRRVVKTRITDEGLRLLAELDKPVSEMHQRQFRHMPARQLRQLSALLDRARAPLENAHAPETES